MRYTYEIVHSLEIQADTNTLGSTLNSDFSLTSRYIY